MTSVGKAAPWANHGSGTADLIERTSLKYERILSYEGSCYRFHASVRGVLGIGGHYVSDQNNRYFVRRFGNEVAWFGEYGGEFANVFLSVREGITVRRSLFDVPQGLTQAREGIAPAGCRRRNRPFRSWGGTPLGGRHVGDGGKKWLSLRNYYWHGGPRLTHGYGLPRLLVGRVSDKERNT